MTAGASSSRSMSRKSRFRNPGNFFLSNPESWILESRIQLKESGTLLKIRIQNPNFNNKDRNPVPGIWNPGSGIQNRIQDCPLHEVPLPLACSPPPLPKTKEKERKKTLGIDAVVVVFFRVEGKLISVFWKKTINAQVHKQLVSRLLLRRVKISRGGSFVSGLVS